MAKQSFKGGALLSPVPAVMVSCGDMENSNIITIAWTGIINTVPPKTYISVRPSRHSHEIIKNTGEFVINLVDCKNIKKADFCGIYTGKKVDKFKRCGFEKEKSEFVSCPCIAQCPVCLECKVESIIPQGSHDMFIANIVNVRVDESIIDKNGKICFEKADLAAFSHGEYFSLGKKIGTFGFSAAKKKGKNNLKKKKKD